MKKIPSESSSCSYRLLLLAQVAVARGLNATKKCFFLVSADSLLMVLRFETLLMFVGSSAVSRKLIKVELAGDLLQNLTLGTNEQTRESKSYEI